ncbi:MAG: YbaB/EbfC family nucleoid-associated protein [Ruminococcus sp.]|nr:YbaB/EbfC family nucleoid-associated protein [Ruminococcus sp.]
MNMQNLMAQAQKMQRDITKKKEEIDNSTFEGKSEWVTVVLNGKKELLKYTLTYDGTITEDDKEMLEDMTKIAFNNATTAIDKEIEEKMGAYSSLGGLF